MLRSLALAVIGLTICAGCDAATHSNQQEQVASLPRYTKNQLDRFRGNNCLKLLPSGLVAPKRFTPELCRVGRVDFSIPDKLFEMSGLLQYQQKLIVTGPDGDPLLIRKVDRHWFESADAERLPNGLFRIRTSGVMGHDPVLESDVVAYLYLHQESGGVCRSSNMSIEPRTFMVVCWHQTPNATLIALGPQGEAATILNNLKRLAVEMDPSA